MGKGSDFKSYVIHIHHRDPKDPKKIFGVVEKVGGKGKVGFLSPNSLWRVLASPSRATPHRENAPKKAKKVGQIRSFAEIMESIREEMEEEGEEEEEEEEEEETDNNSQTKKPLCFCLYIDL